jgi:glycosyltransferase involved in cell wall biosynthesis
MHLTVATIVRNEAGRFLPSALASWREFADRIVVLDDGSTDGTAELCEAAGAEVHRRPGEMFGGEWKARKALWGLAAGGAEWVLHLDADQTVSCDPRPFLRPPVSCFRVFDLWGENEYREDAWWTGHLRCWWPAVHVPSLPPGFVDQWPERGWHSGHVPMNLPGERHAVNGCAILHYAYASPELREQAAEKYRNLAPHLTPQERFHAKTITSRNPPTKPLPFEPTWRLALST